MANPHKGEVLLQAGEDSYKLSFSVNALCELEEAMGLNVTQIGKRLSGDVALKDVRLLLWAGLLDHHPGIDLRKAGIIMTIATPQVVGAAIGEAFQKAFPQEDAGARPPKGRKAGTG
jgi:hypothetical protein